ncbi:MAG TPA: hypothetical protein VFI11_13980 [Anaerolineales bacterium]|nr:hypothetical protein [Anaerolineales bacterium]
MKLAVHRSLLALLAVALAACGALNPPSGPPPLEVPPTTPSPVAEVEFVMTPAVVPPIGASLVLRLLDEVSGLANNVIDVPLETQADGTWRTRLTPPVGTVLRYRYVRTSPGTADEITASGDAVRYRLAVVTGSMVVSDIVAAWQDAPYSGPTGRIIGNLTEAGSGAPLEDILVTAGGVRAFTDGQGAFRLDHLPPGLHNFAALSPTGAHLPAQQGAILAAESATPATLTMTRADPIQVSFEVTVPPDTPENAVVRVIGNVRTLGNLFTDLPGGQSVDVTVAVPLIMVDPTHYLALTTLYAGTDLRYKYTLGDGFWNAERTSEGAFLTRQVVLPTRDVLSLGDVVSTWHAAQGDSYSFQVTGPPASPPGENVSLQLSASGWTTPLPMWPVSQSEWRYTLHSPTAWNPPLHYRFCRNQQCGAADDIDTPGPQSEGRTLITAAPGVDTVSAWAAWDPEAVGATVVAPEILPRPSFEAGYEIQAPFDPTWTSYLPAALAEMAAGGANVVALTPSWTLGPVAPTPPIGFDPALAPFAMDLTRQAGAAQAAGLGVVLHPRLLAPEGDSAAWWTASPRNGAWWSVWFELYRSFALTYATVAERSGAVKLVLGGPEVIPALPSGVLADGSPSGAPSDAEARWRALLAEVRTIFHGRLAWEVDFGSTLQGVPVFADAVDEIHVLWRAPLGEGTEVTPEQMQQEAYKLLDTILLAEESLEGRLIFLSLEYLSIDGAAAACAPAPDGTCRPPSQFNSGAVVDPDLVVDLPEQNSALNAVLLAAYGRENVRGFYVRGFHPAVALQDKSTSVRGKPAQQMLSYWFPRLTGR